MPPAINDIGSRQKTYSVLIDVLPNFAVLLAFVLFFVAISGSIGIIFFAPAVESFLEEKIQPHARNTTISDPNDLSQYFTGDLSVIQESERFGSVNKTNQQLIFTLLFKEKSDFVLELDKQDVQLETTVEAKNSKYDNYSRVQGPTKHTRSLQCSTQKKYFCTPIVTFVDRYINYPFYRVTVNISGLAEVYTTGFLDDVIYSQIETTNSEYTLFETILRALFVLISIIVTVYYSVMLFRMQTWSYCKLEQKWLLVVLISLIFFNNPLYIGSWATVGTDPWFWPMLNVLFQANCASLLLFFIMIMTHSAVLPTAAGERHRTFWSFYAIKILLVLSLWLLITITLLWERFNQATDPSFEATEIPFYGQIRIAVVIVAVTIFIMITYYILRAVAGDDLLYVATQALNRSSADVRGGGYRQYRSHYSVSYRFRFFLALTFLVLVTIGVDFSTFLLVDYANNAAQYLSIFPLLNYYVILLAVFFLPSNQVEVASRDIITSGMFLNDDDEEEDKGMLSITPTERRKTSDNELIDVKLDIDDEDEER
jgi:hypothetical protein